MSNVGIYDPTEVMNSASLNLCQREGWVKLAFFLISFFVYLYRYVQILLKQIFIDNIVVSPLYQLYLRHKS